MCTLKASGPTTGLDWFFLSLHVGMKNKLLPLALKEINNGLLETE